MCSRRSFPDGAGDYPGYPGTYDERSAIHDLEYQVEQGYRDQSINFGDRKSVMGLLDRKF